MYSFCTGFLQNTRDGFPGLSRTFLGLFSMNFQDFVRRVEMSVFNTVNATFAAHCYTTPYKLLCHFASNVPVLTNANCSQAQLNVPDVTKILQCLVIVQRDHRKICHTSYSHFRVFPGLRPDSRTFQAWKMWLLNSRTLHDLYEPCLYHYFIHAPGKKINDKNILLCTVRRFHDKHSNSLASEMCTCVSSMQWAEINDNAEQRRSVIGQPSGALPWQTADDDWQYNGYWAQHHRQWVCRWRGDDAAQFDGLLRRFCPYIHNNHSTVCDDYVSHYQSSSSSVTDSVRHASRTLR